MMHQYGSVHQIRVLIVFKFAPSFLPRVDWCKRLAGSPMFECCHRMLDLHPRKTVDANTLFCEIIDCAIRRMFCIMVTMQSSFGA